MATKSDRLRKLESELADLRKWLELGLVPKKDEKRHKDEIKSIEKKISNENTRLEYLKKSGQPDDIAAAPKRNARNNYNDNPTMPDVDFESEPYQEESFSNTETTEMETTSYDTEADEETTATYDDAKDDPFHEKNRWKKRDIIDPEADDW